MNASPASDALQPFPRTPWARPLAGVVSALLLALSAAAETPPAPARPNLVLITLDTTRADHLGAWGWPHAQTPHLDALAARGVRFVRCDTAAPITLPSHATMLTGLFPPRHGVRDNGTFVLPAGIPTVAEQLAAAGYDTGAVVSAVVLARRHGLDRGFRLYDDDLGSGYAAGTVVSERTADATTALARVALSQLRAPFFLWVHYFDPHEEYRPPSRFADTAAGPHRLYDGEISFMDEQIGALLAALPPATNLVVVGDHGEMLGDHGETTHGLLLHRGVRRVPLILAGPDVPAGRRHECLVLTADVTPTLLHLAGLEPPPALDGRSLLPLPASGKGCDRTSYSESFLPFFAYRWYPLRALASDRVLFLQAPRSSLYHLTDDPAEERDLAAEEPAALRLWSKRMVDLLATAGETLEADMRPENVLSGEQRQQLESLGYLGGTGGGGVSTALPDPRQMVDVAVRLHTAFQQVQQGKCAETLAELQRIVERDPQNFPALTLAGTCLRQAGRIESALALFQRAARANELSAVPVANAAGCLLALNRLAEAEREYRKALTLDPTLPEAATNLARLLRGARRQPEARAVLDAAVAAGSHDPLVYLERGVVRAELGAVAEALDDFRQAVRRSPGESVPLENAAHAAYQLGRIGEAAQFYEQLVRLQPDRLDLWKTLGAIYHFELRDREAALRCFRQALILEFDPAEREQLEGLVHELGG